MIKRKSKSTKEKITMKKDKNKAELLDNQEARQLTEEELENVVGGEPEGRRNQNIENSCEEREFAKWQ